MHWRTPLLAFGILATSVYTAHAIDPSIRVTFQKKGTDTLSKGAQNRAVQAEQNRVVYAIGITNGSIRPLPAMKLEYKLFVEREQLGGKKGSERIERITGTKEVAAMNPNTTVSIETDGIELKSSSLDTGKFYYIEGGKEKAKDTFKGVWLRLMDGDKVVTEFINPPSLTQRQKWDVAPDDNDRVK